MSEIGSSLQTIVFKIIINDATYMLFSFLLYLTSILPYFIPNHLHDFLVYERLSSLEFPLSFFDVKKSFSCTLRNPAWYMYTMFNGVCDAILYRHCWFCSHICFFLVYRIFSLLHFFFFLLQIYNIYFICATFFPLK